MLGLYIVCDLKKNTYVIILLSHVFNETPHVFLTFLLSVQLPYCQLTKYVNDDTFYNNLLFNFWIPGQDTKFINEKLFFTI